MPASSLRRSTTLRGSSAANRAAVARRAASKKRATKIKRTASLTAKRGAINATEAYKIAAAAALDLKEDKFFNVSPDGYWPLAPQTTGNMVCSVQAWGTISNQQIDPAQPSGTRTMEYGGVSMKDMQMLMPFDQSAGGEFNQYHPDGKSVKPNGGVSNWTFQRPPVFVPIRDRTSGVPPAAPETYRTLPMRVRIVRVTPKQARGVVEDINPDRDLFQNQYGIQHGVGSADFTTIDLEYSKVNPEKYATLQDSKFTLLPSCVYQTTVNTEGNDTSVVEQNSTAPTTQSCKNLTMNHQIVQRKGGDVRYLTDGGSIASWKPVEGMRREFVFIHAWYINTGNGLIPDATGSGTISLPNGQMANIHDLNIGHRFRSTFKDV